MPAKEVTFVSRSRNHHVVIPGRARRPSFERDAAGNVVASGIAGGPVPEGSYFRNGSDEAPSGVLFQNWKFTTDDPELIDALRNHPDFESKYGWKEAYDASRDSVDDLQERIAGLAAEGDADGLRDLIAEEESAGDGGRATVLRSARAALDRLSGSDSGAEAAGATQTKKSRSGKSKADAESRPADG
jgi:hypothetical protein